MKNFLNYIADGYRQYEKEYSDMAFNATEATKVGKRQVPVYAAIKGTRGHYKVIGHVSQSATSTGATKAGKKHGAKAAKKSMGLRSEKMPEGPGWVILTQSGPNAKEVFITEADSKYIVEKNPHDGKWYAMGHVGRNKWMPVSSGFKSKAQAQKWAKSQVKVDIAARGEVGGV